MLFTDTHAHLTDARYDGDLDAVLARAHNAGIVSIICVGTDVQSSRTAVALARPSRPAVYATAGLHPSAASDPHSPEELQEIAALLRTHKDEIVAIGETGLDYYRGHTYKEEQIALFEEHLALAQAFEKPLIVHNRAATEDVVRLLGRHPGLTGVAHCFSEDERALQSFLDAGFYVSFAGNITFPRAGSVVRAAEAIPLDRLLLETDSPYLAPQDRRGERNEPSFIVSTAETLARWRGLSTEDIARITTRNARRLFGLKGHSRSDTLAYPIRNSLYLNITNQCSNLCTFCPRQGDYEVKGHELDLSREPTTAEILSAVQAQAERRRSDGRPPYDEIVFCGFGEPTMRLEVLREVAAACKKKGFRVRLNTNGQGSLVNGRDILPDLSGVVDCVSVSLNSTDPDQYLSLCRPPAGRKAFDAMLEFLRRAPQYIREVVATAVDMPGVDIEACRRFAEETGIRFRTRKYKEVG